MKSRKTFAANLAGGSVVRHLPSLPEVPKVSQHRTVDSPNVFSTATSTDSSSCVIKPSAKNDSSRYDINDIPLFKKLLSGIEPSVLPGTASAWICVHNGGTPMSIWVQLGLRDRINLHSDCFTGTCMCEHFVGRCISQLKPCYFASFFVHHLSSLSEADAYVLHGIYYGFPIIDSTLVRPYFCENYGSITTGDGFEQMSERINTELLQGKISETTEAVSCVHALGAIFKANGSIRPITDCKRPLGLSINNSMENTCYTFSYSNIDTVCSFVNQGDYLCVVDIANAYRSINIFPSHVYFQAFSWTIHGETKVYLEYCLSFGLKSAPFIFTKVGDYIVKCLGFKNVNKMVNYIDDFLICALLRRHVRSSCIPSL